MLVRGLIDYLLSEIGSGRLCGSDPVPSGIIFRKGNDGHIDVLEYLEGKYDIKRGVDIGGQKNT